MKFNYFFNSLYLLTNKTQMKMKKTQSLKLMLLGLMALVSGSAWAQYTAVDKVVYGLNATQDGAVVLGVLSSLPDGEFGGDKAIQIADAVTIKGTEYKVVDFDANWKKAGKFTCDPVQGTAGSTTNPADPGLTDGSEWVVTPGQGATAPSAASVYTTVDATQVAPTVELVLRASKLTEITRDDIDGLPIAAFIIGKDSGIEEIPENLFAATQMVREENPENAANKAAWDAAQAVIEGYNEYFITDGVYDGKVVYVSKKRVGLQANGKVNTGADMYFVLGTVQEKRNLEFCKEAFLLTYDGTEGKEKVTVADKSYYPNWVKVSGDDLLIYVNGEWKVAATKFDGNDYAKAITGLQDIYDTAVQDEAAKKTAYEDAVAAWETAIANKTYPNNAFTEAQLDRKAKAEALQAAINAIKNNDCFETLKQEVQTQLGTAVTDLTEWFCAYALANNLVQTSCDWSTETTNFIDKYNAFYATEAAPIPSQKVTAYKFTSFGATGNPQVRPTEGIIVPTAGITFTQYATGLIADETEVTSEENTAAKAQGFSRVRVLTNSVDSYKDKIYYVKINPTTKEINPNTYYVLYTYNSTSKKFEMVAEGAHTANLDVVYNATAQAAFTSATEGKNYYDLTLTWSSGDKSFNSTISNAEGKIWDGDQNPVINAFVVVGDEEIAVNNKYVLRDAGNNVTAVYSLDADGNLYKWTELNNGNFSGSSEKWTAKAQRVSWTKTEEQQVPDLVMTVKIGASQDYVLVPEPNINPEIAAAYPGNDIEAAIAAATPQSPEALQQAVDNAETAMNNAKTAWDNAKTATQTALDNLNTQKGLVDAAKNFYENNFYVNTYLYDKDGQNEILEHVAFNNGIITSIGDHAFANCVYAQFSNGTFPATIEYVGEEAFLNTLIANADFSTAASEDLMINADAFKGTPLQTLLLNGTTSEQITPAVVKTIVQSLAKEDGELTFCAATDPVAVKKAIPSLTTVTLPAREKYNTVAAGTFEKCINLSSVVIPEYVTTIGAKAFNYTSVQNFDLTANKGLKSIGKYAFANNPALQSVLLAPEATVTALDVTTFENSCQLATVAFNDAMMSLPEGLFATNALTALQLCNTHVDYLANLFMAGPGEEEGDRLPNTTLTSVCLPDGLLAIDNFALSSCKGLTTVDIPGSVFLMGDGVFYNDTELTTVNIIDSRMVGLPAHTFSQCEKLSDVTFITLETINPNPEGNNVYQSDFPENKDIAKIFSDLLEELGLLVDAPEGETVPGHGIYLTPEQREMLYKIIDLADEGQCFGDNIFHGAGIYSTHKFANAEGVMVPKTLVTVGFDSYNKLKGGNPVYAEAYSKLATAETKITFKDGNLAGGSYWKTYQSNYGTWIKAGQGQIVYSAYQDGNTIVLYPAKIKNGYYKIAAYDGENDKAAAAVVRSLTKEFSFEQKTNPDQKYQTTLDYENQLEILKDEFTGNSNLNVYYMAVQGTEPTFFKTIESITLPEGWVVFKTEGYLGQGARVNIIDEDEATAVLGVKEYLDGGAIYNLQGVRVSSPVKGQMYIQSGKKFIQK